MQGKITANNVRGDLSGALTSAIISIPMSMGYGIIVFSPLGMEFAPMGALAGVYTAVVAGFFSSLFGGTSIQISGPGAPLALVLSSLVAHLAADPIIGSSPTIVLSLTSLCIIAAGVLQVVFGIMGSGNIVAHIPKPVVAGFINGIALLIIFRQIRMIIGVNGDIAMFEIIRNPVVINPITLSVGIITILSIYFSKCCFKGIPSSLTALIAGTGSYYFLIFFVSGAPSCEVIGELQTCLPTPSQFFHSYKEIQSSPIKGILPRLVFTSFLISLIGAMESMLSSVASDKLTCERHDIKKEMIGQGVGNITAAFLGSIGSSGSIVRSTANYEAGGRTPLSGMLCSVIILLTILLFHSDIGKIPVAVVAGILFVVALSMIDKLTLVTFKRICAFSGCPEEARLDMLINCSVAVAIISINL